MSAGAMPNRARPTSVRRAPTSPAKPRTSPARTSNDTSPKTPSRPSPRTSRTTSPGSPGVRWKKSLRVRPTISRIAIAGVSSERGRVDTQRPSRRTVTRSEISKTSSIRCEMNRMATPSRRSDSTIPNSRRTSWAESEAVGSSMIRTRTCNESALAISTVCCSARVRPRAGSSVSRRTPSRPRIASASRRIRATVDHAAAVAMADEDVLRDRQVREDHRLLVDRRDPQILGVEGARRATPPRRRSPSCRRRAARRRS